VDSRIPSPPDLAVIYFVGALGTLFLPLFFTGLGTIRGRVASLWAGLVISTIDLGLMFCCLLGVDALLWLIDLGNVCGNGLRGGDVVAREQLWHRDGEGVGDLLGGGEKGEASAHGVVSVTAAGRIDHIGPPHPPA
jgi:hypothetical protein